MAESREVAGVQSRSARSRSCQLDQGVGLKRGTRVSSRAGHAHAGFVRARGWLIRMID
jgi:hypothetical protein